MASLLSFTCFGEQFLNCFLTTEWLLINQGEMRDKQNVTKKKKRNSQPIKLLSCQVMTELLQTFSLKVHCFAVLASEGVNSLATE